MALRAGEFSLHHELAVHRSAPNNASHRRVGIGLNYIPPHVRVNGPVRLKAMLVRGEDRYGHFDLIDPPAAERDAAALAVHQEVSDRYRENYRIQVQRHEAAYARADDLATRRRGTGRNCQGALMGNRLVTQFIVTGPDGP